jgi:pimeloyl-ACP methyl ester carboxylesterase
MKTNIIILVVSLLTLVSCQKEEIKIGTGVSETFYVQNAGTSMRVLVEGNTASKAILLFVHGGPGSSSYFYNSDYISQNIEDKYAVAYWDQRSAGASQGNNNGDQLNLKTMTTDLKKVIQVLKHRYGQDASVFILGHSFGGMLTASFVTTENNQALVKGWIMCSGAHNYPLNNELSKSGLIFFANQQIALNKRVAQWREILNYCNSIPNSNLTKEQADKLNTYSSDTESYFDEVIPVSAIDIIKANAIKQNYALTSTYLNLKYSQIANINNELANYELSSQLNKVTIPVLTIFGKYDLICPPALGNDVYNRISSTYKFQYILPNSSHVGMLQEEILFCNRVNSFMELFK